MIWYVNVSMEKWLDIYPSLNESLPLTCECGNHLEALKPFIEKHFAGIETTSCNCGASPVKIFTYRKKEQGKDFYNKLMLLV